MVKCTGFPFFGGVIRFPGPTKMLPPAARLQPQWPGRSFFSVLFGAMKQMERSKRLTYNVAYNQNLMYT